MFSTTYAAIGRWSTQSRWPNGGIFLAAGVSRCAGINGNDQSTKTESSLGRTSPTAPSKSDSRVSGISPSPGRLGRHGQPGNHGARTDVSDRVAARAAELDARVPAAAQGEPAATGIFRIWGVSRRPLTLAASLSRRTRLRLLLRLAAARDSRLTWREVDLEGGVIRLDPERSKTKLSRVLPLAPPLHDVLTRRLTLRRFDTTHVFHWEGGLM